MFEDRRQHALAAACQAELSFSSTATPAAYILYQVPALSPRPLAHLFRTAMSAASSYGLRRTSWGSGWVVYHSRPQSSARPYRSSISSRYSSTCTYKKEGCVCLGMRGGRAGGEAALGWVLAGRPMLVASPTSEGGLCGRGGSDAYTCRSRGKGKGRSLRLLACWQGAFPRPPPPKLPRSPALGGCHAACLS